MIAHRLHTVVDAHRIFMIEDGSVIESGRHDDLLRKRGRYASFYRLQLRDQEPAACGGCFHGMIGESMPPGRGPRHREHRGDSRPDGKDVQIRFS